MADSKRYVRPAALVVSALMAAVLAGCGGGSSSDDDTPPVTPPATPKTYVDSLVLPASAIKSVAANDVPAAQVAVFAVQLPAWDAAKSAETTVPGMAMQIGAARAVDALASVAQVNKALPWKLQADGSHVAAVSITSGGAYGLRVGVQVEQLPDNAVIRVYRADLRDKAYQTTGESVNALLALNRAAGDTSAAAKTWWTPDMGAGETTIEIALPASVNTAAVQIAIPTVSHVFQNLALPTETEWAEFTKATSGACNLDATCTTNYALERNAVARMTFVSDGNGYLCTGTLLNNSKADFTPYFITANHCISTQASATSMQTNWFYRSASCNSTSVQSNTAVRARGATLLYATATTDTTLLQLNEMPPAGTTLAGWDARNTVTARNGATAGSAMYGLHHPKGDLLKYSEGALEAYTNCTTSGQSLSCSTGDAQSNYYRVLWTKGVTEGGSSGSGIFNNGRLVGTLTGGSSQCGVIGGSDSYGRFDKAFNSRLNEWLAQ